MKIDKSQIKNIVKNNTVRLDSYRQGHLYYNIDFEGATYQFTVPTDDVGTATMAKEDKALYYMRWITPAIEQNTFVKIYG